MAFIACGSPIVQCADIAPAASPRTCHVDSRKGLDASPGTREHPWKSLGPLSTVTFNPGNSVRFARGSAFEGGFAVKGNFRLKQGSPAIGAGLDLGYAIDFDRRPIPANRRPDIGAFQFAADGE